MLYMHVCVFAHVHTHPTGTEGIIFTSEMHNFVLQSSLPPPPPPPKWFTPKEAAHSTWFLDELWWCSIFGVFSYTWVPHWTLCGLSLNPLLWKTSGRRALALKEEEGNKRNGRDPHFCPDYSGHQVLPYAPRDTRSLGPPDTACHHGEHHSLIPSTFSC